MSNLDHLITVEKLGRSIVEFRRITYDLIESRCRNVVLRGRFVIMTYTGSRNGRQ